MPILDLDAARQFFASQPSLPMMVYLYDSPEAAEVARQVGLDPEQLIAAYNRTLFGDFAAAGPSLLSGAALSLDELRIVSHDSAVQSIALADIAEFRPGFEVAEIVLCSGERLRLHSELIPFLRLCVECMRELHYHQSWTWRQQ